MYKCRLLIILVNSLDPDQVISADDKDIENIPACNELNPLAMDLIGRLNTSEFVNGGMPPAKVSLRWSVQDCRRI